MPKKNFFADDYGVQISAGIKRPIYSVDEQIDFYQMPIEQPAYPVYSAPVFSPAPVEVFPINEMPIEQPAYPMQPILPTLEGGGTPISYEVPKFDVEPPTLYTPLPDYPIEPPTLYTPLPDYPIEQPAYTVVPTPDFPIKTVEPVSPIDEFIPPITDVPPFSDDTETGGGVVKNNVPETKPTLPETKPVSKNLTPYVYAGLGIVVILLVARMVSKKD